MTRDDIIRLAREAGFTQEDHHAIYANLVYLAELVAAAEREACAALCDDMAQEEQGKVDRDYSREDTAEELAVWIRARGQH